MKKVYLQLLFQNSIFDIQSKSFPITNTIYNKYLKANSIFFIYQHYQQIIISEQKQYNKTSRIMMRKNKLADMFLRKDEARQRKQKFQQNYDQSFIKCDLLWDQQSLSVIKIHAILTKGQHAGEPISLQCKWYLKTKTDFQPIQGVSTPFYQPCIHDFGGIISVHIEPKIPNGIYKGVTIIKEAGPIRRPLVLQKMCSEFQSKLQTKFKCIVQGIFSNDNKLQFVETPLECQISISLQSIRFVRISNQQEVCKYQICEKWPQVQVIRKTNNSILLNLSSKDTMKIKFMDNLKRDFFSITIGRIKKGEFLKKMDRTQLDLLTQFKFEDSKLKQQLRDDSKVKQQSRDNSKVKQQSRDYSKVKQQLLDEPKEADELSISTQLENQSVKTQQIFNQQADYNRKPSIDLTDSLFESGLISNDLLEIQKIEQNLFQQQVSQPLISQHDIKLQANESANEITKDNYNKEVDETHNGQVTESKKPQKAAGNNQQNITYQQESFNQHILGLIVKSEPTTKFHEQKITNEQNAQNSPSQNSPKTIELGIQLIDFSIAQQQKNNDQTQYQSKNYSNLTKQQKIQSSQSINFDSNSDNKNTKYLNNQQQSNCQEIQFISPSKPKKLSISQFNILHQQIKSDKKKVQRNLQQISNNKITQLKKQIQQLSRDKSKVQLLYKKQKQMNVSLTDQMKRYRSDILSQLQSVKKELQSAKRQNQNLKVQNQNLKKVQKQSTQNSQKLIKLQGEHRFYKNQVSLLKKQVKSLTESSNAKTIQQKELREQKASEVRIIRESCPNDLKIIEQLRQKIDRMRRQFQQSEQNNMNKIDNHEAEINRLSKKNESLIQENKILAQKRQQAKNQEQKWKKLIVKNTNNDTSEKSKNDTIQHIECTKKISNLQFQLKNLQMLLRYKSGEKGNQSLGLQKLVNKLTEDISERQLQLESLRLVNKEITRKLNCLQKKQNE